MAMSEILNPKWSLKIGDKRVSVILNIEDDTYPQYTKYVVCPVVKVSSCMKNVCNNNIPYFINQAPALPDLKHAAVHDIVYMQFMV